MSSIIRTLFDLASPAGKRGRLSTLIYHRVLAARDPMRAGVASAEAFDGHMELLARHFNVLPLEEGIARLANGTLPARAAAITFDDGYADNVTTALPILQRHGLPATFFIATGFLNGGRMWNDTIIEAVRRVPGETLHLELARRVPYSIRSYADRSAAAYDIIHRMKYRPAEEQANIGLLLERRADGPLPDDLMMTEAQIRILVAAGMGIGGHTHTHPILAELPDSAAEHEIVEGKSILEAIAGNRVTLFAYPNGKPGADYLPRHVGIVRAAGFTAAVSTAWGAARRSSDRYQIQRFTPWDRTPSRFHARLLTNLYRDAV